MVKIPNPEAKYVGSEPNCAGLSANDQNYRIQLLGMLNWYNYNLDTKLAKQILVEFARSHRPNVVKNVSSTKEDRISLTHAALARILMQGGQLTPAHTNQFYAYIDSLVPQKIEEPIDTTPKIPRPSIQDIMHEKITEYLGELEGVYDQIISGDDSFKLYNDLMKRQLPQQYAPAVITWSQWKIKELQEVLETEDIDLLDSYSFLNSRRIKQIVKALEGFISDAERYGQYKKANRKPRAKKAKPASQQVAKLKFMKEFAELSLKSIQAADIIGAEQVWIYNTANKKLAVYRTDSASGIQVKGTTLQNYDPDISEQRTLRKPDETIKQVLTGGKIQLRKVLTNLSTKTSPVNGRVNEDCILLRAVK